MKDWKKELLEKWADIEHKRWSRWQEYMHSKLVNVYEDKNILGLPVEDFKHWERQIATDYKDLSEAEKESDREQVYPYIKDIEELLDKQKKEIIEELNSIKEKIGTLRQLVGEGLEDADVIYEKLNEITPLMSKEQEREFDKQLNKLKPRKKRIGKPRADIQCPVCGKYFKSIPGHFSALYWKEMKSSNGKRTDKFAKDHWNYSMENFNEIYRGGLKGGEHK